MPVDLTALAVSQVRTSQGNAISTAPPKVNGTFTGLTEREYLLIVETNGDVGVAEFGFIKDDISFDAKDQKWVITGPLTGTGILATAASVLEDGLTIEWFDSLIDGDPALSFDVQVLDQLALDGASDPTAFIAPPWLSRSTDIKLFKNGIEIFEGVGFTIDLTQGIILFTNQNLGEVLTAAAPPLTNALSTSQPSIIVSTAVLREDAVLKTLDVDYIVNLGGLFEFIQVIVAESLTGASPFLNDESALFGDVVQLKLNGNILNIGDDFVLQTEGGWITLEQALFELDTLTISYTTEINDVETEIVDENLILPSGIADGGEIAFETANRPVILKTFEASEGDTQFTIEDLDIAANYPEDRIFSVGLDFYIAGQDATFDGSDTTIFPSIPLVRDYINPALRFVTGPVVFSTELNAYRNIPISATRMIFDGVDLTDRYKSDIFIKFGERVYLCAGSVFDADENLTTVNFNTPFTEPHAATETLEFNDVSLLQAGGTTLELQNPIITTSPFELRKNTVPLVVNDDYAINSSGLITLQDPIVQGDDFEMDYIGRRDLVIGTLVDVDYTFPQPVPAKTEIKADYLFENPDNFFFRVVTEQTFLDELTPQLKQDKNRALNPAASGSDAFEVTPDGNATKGLESREFTLDFLETKDRVGKKEFEFFDERSGAFVEENEVLDGTIIGANDGPVTETNIQDAGVGGFSRLFPDITPQYTKQTPRRVEYLLGNPLNDDGTSTGGSTTNNLTKHIADELAANQALQVNIPLLLLESNTTSTSSVGPFTIVLGVDDNLTWDRDGAGVKMVTFPPGALTAATAVILINGADAGASSVVGGAVEFTFTTSIVVGGNARPNLGFPTGTDRAASAAAVTFNAQRALVSAATTAELPLIDREQAALVIILQETTEPAFSNATSRSTEIDDFETETNQAITDFNPSLNLDVDLDLTTYEATLPGRELELTDQQTEITARLVEIDDALLDGGSETLLATVFGWIDFRVNRGTGALTQFNTELTTEENAEDTATALTAVLDSL